MVGVFGLLQQGVHVPTQVGAQLPGADVAAVPVLGGTGIDVRAVQADGAELEEFQFPGQFEHVHEGAGRGLEVVPAEGADRVMIGLGVGGEVTHGDVAIGGALDAVG